MRNTSQEIRDFVETYKQIEDNALQLIPAEGKAQLDERTYSRCFYSTSQGPAHDFTLSAITDDGLEFATEYNDACGCHPEMTTATIYLAWDKIEALLGEAWNQP